MNSTIITKVETTQIALMDFAGRGQDGTSTFYLILPAPSPSGNDHN